MAGCLSPDRKLQVSLLNVPQERAYRCCTHCEITLAKLGANNIHIDDLWKTALLSIGKISNKEPYPWRELIKQEKVLKEFGKLTSL